VGLKGQVEDPTSRSSVSERHRFPENPLAEGAAPNDPPCEEAVHRVLTEALLLEDPGPDWLWEEEAMGLDDTTSTSPSSSAPSNS
jgi:hypothetical protein